MTVGGEAPSGRELSAEQTEGVLASLVLNDDKQAIWGEKFPLPEGRGETKGIIEYELVDKMSLQIWQL